MNGFPDFSSYGYQVEKELGCNRAGGRVTYLAQANDSNLWVVIKQFQFARSSGGWESYDLYRREIEVLRGLNHPGIPRYLNSFQTEAGFCIVQEYKPAISLGISRSFSSDEICQIAKSVLEILVYLQNRIPLVIHRDIKPENILVDEQMNVYLIDFGFARIGEGEVGISSAVKGTLGFMPPEQLFNRQLTEASDLYSLGMTLICLLTRTKSDQIGNLIDVNYQIRFKPLLPKLNFQWATWLETLVEPNLKARYPNASAALEEMPAIPLRSPEVKCSQAQLVFTAAKLGEQLSQTITIANFVPETLLQGAWEVVAHPSDPPHTPDAHAWINLHPATFSGNQIECQISVNTYKLMAGTTYQRTIRLKTNAFPKTYTLDVQVKTAPVPIQHLRLPYGFLMLIFLGFGAAAWLATLALFGVELALQNSMTVGFGITVGAAIGFQVVTWMLITLRATAGVIAPVLAGLLSGLLALLSVLVTDITLTTTPLMLGIGIGIVGSVSAGLAIGDGMERLVKQGFGRFFAASLAFATAAAGFSIGLCLAPRFINPVLVLTSGGIGALWTIIAAYVPLRRKEMIAAYRQFEQHLIRP
ncbi:MAG: serine/threonine protein kinase [Cyanobacteria bacterium RM1_2_2]|nr:serine/threonine protein kinase [Cyanobacteria bacterium RM1_2_2]